MDDVFPDSPAGIEVIPLETHEQVATASALLAGLWGEESGMPPHLLRALAHSGNYVFGVYDGAEMVATSVAFFAKPAERSMHSHVTGVKAEQQGRGLGRLLKHHQRQWAFDREVGRITWTFDPLVARNAHFNIAVLGVRVADYLVDHYGTMSDGVNGGDESDRVMVAWNLAAPAHAPQPDEVVATVAIPRDIMALRRESPADAAAWRTRVRDVFIDHISDGLHVGGFDDERGYLFVR